MHYLTDPGPWTDGVGDDLSIVALMANGTIPALPAAALWWALERGASLLTAGGPQGAGKSTLANALLAFLPEAARVYVVAGNDDPMEPLAGDGPTYLLVSELSVGGPVRYLRPPAAQRLFARLRHGERLVGTLHADSVAEAVDALRQDFGLPATDIARAGIIAISRITGGFTTPTEGRHRRPGAEAERRIVEIGLLAPSGDGVGVTPLTAWDGAARRLTLQPNASAALGAWAAVPGVTAEAAIRDRAAALATLLEEGRQNPAAVVAAVQRFAAPRT